MTTVPALSFATSASELVGPILDGRVEAEGFELLASVCSPSEIFWRQLHYGGFDVAEMALPALLVAREHGIEMVALPAFPARRFPQVELSAHPDSGIDAPADIAGKRFAVVEFAQASMVWTRGILEHDFGVKASSVTWIVERSDEVSYASAVGFTPPEGVRVEHMPAGETLRTMLETHQADVAPAGAPRALTVVERNRMASAGREVAYRPVFDDKAGECRRFFAAHGYIPSNHCYALRADVAREHPAAVSALWRALVASKALADAEQHLPDALFFDAEYLARTAADFGDDPYPYGFAANRQLLADLIGFCHEQGVIGEAPAPEALFPEELLDT
ncbi:MAG TPA: ABC transporter substrate-binding protein [Acidimicrobiales bacterium]|nr:ABC transporter substrate-binding protein [Acidimicrobiales bacterium]